MKQLRSPGKQQGFAMEENVPPLARRLIRGYLEDDIADGDITCAATLGPGKKGKAHIVCKEDGIVSGIEYAAVTLEEMGCGSVINARSGEPVSRGDIVLRTTGNVASILQAERTALNILLRMSGIATRTARLVALARKANPDIRIACTRKTTPGFGYFEKRAVIHGGGDTHRLNLSDMVLIKDNHAAHVGSVGKAVQRALESVSFSKKVEAEAATIEMALEAAGAGAHIVMLDNFEPKEAARAYAKLKKAFPQLLIEVSGGINDETLPLYAKAADVISIGALTHSYKSLDFSLELD